LGVRAAGRRLLLRPALDRAAPDRPGLRLRASHPVPAAAHPGPQHPLTLREGSRPADGRAGPPRYPASMESWRRADVPVLPGSGPAPRLHDTATGGLVLAAAGPVATLYACGITPYDATHIGHAATYTAWDLLVRAWLDAAPETREAGGAPGG